MEHNTNNPNALPAAVLARLAADNNAALELKGQLTEATKASVPMNDVDDFILRGETQSGDVFFYTGRTGAEWISADCNEAFGYRTLGAANRKARMLNRGHWAHRVWFEAVPVAGPAVGA